MAIDFGPRRRPLPRGECRGDRPTRLKPTTRSTPQRGSDRVDPRLIEREVLVDLAGQPVDHVDPLVAGQRVVGSLAVDLIVHVTTQDDVPTATTGEFVVAIAAHRPDSWVRPGGRWGSKSPFAGIRKVGKQPIRRGEGRWASKSGCLGHMGGIISINFRIAV